MTDDLISRLEQAGPPCRELDAAIAVASGQYVPDRYSPGQFFATNAPTHSSCGIPNYTASIDAALTLATGEAIERVGGAIGILRWAIDMMREAGAGIDALPRFIVIAALRAQEDREHG